MAHRSDKLDVNFTINIVYNSHAFKKTIIRLAKKTDLLAAKDAENLLAANEFMATRAYSMLNNRYSIFQQFYAEVFFAHIIVSN